MSPMGEASDSFYQSQEKELSAVGFQAQASHISPTFFLQMSDPIKRGTRGQIRQSLSETTVCAETNGECKGYNYTY